MYNIVVEKYGAATYIQGSVYSHNHEQVYMYNIEAYNTLLVFKRLSLHV